jgi:hypothetical protein
MEMHQLGQDLRHLPSSENARVLEMTDAGDGLVLNKEDALARNRPPPLTRPPSLCPPAPASSASTAPFSTTSSAPFTSASPGTSQSPLALCFFILTVSLLTNAYGPVTISTFMFTLLFCLQFP